MYSALCLFKDIVYLGTLSRLVIVILIKVSLEHNFLGFISRGLAVVELLKEVWGLIVPGT